ncbi:MAG: hypothetical protein ACTJHU_00295 [Mycetocola sp.]
MREAGIDVPIVAEAADMTTSELEDRLFGRTPFDLSELVKVGGFLRIPAYKFLEVAA